MRLAQQVAIGACAGIIDEISNRNYESGISEGSYDLIDFYQCTRRILRSMKDMEVGKVMARAGVYLEMVSDVYRFDVKECVIHFDFEKVDRQYQ